MVASESAVSRLHLQPLVRLVDWVVVGVDPTIMGIGPAPAIKALLKRNNLQLEQVDLVEVGVASEARKCNPPPELLFHECRWSL